MPNKSPPAEEFYNRILSILTSENIPFVIGGGFAVSFYTDGLREPTTGDLDIFCKAGDFPRAVSSLKEAHFNIEIRDDRWIAKATEKDYHIDLLFSSPNYLISVDENWFKNAPVSKIFGSKYKIVPKEELIWCKTYVQDRNRFDGADINHLILLSGKNLDWKRLLSHMENHWEILLSLLINFRFIYPSERGMVPNWLMNELLSRLTYQIKDPIPKDRICRGPLVSRTQYKADITKLKFETIL